MKKLILSTLLASFVCIAMLKAEVKLPNVFSDDMVLQCSMPIRFWGLGDKNTSVEVELGKNKVSAIVSKDGKWSLELPAMVASNKPKDIKVYENGKLVKTIKNVLVGEVWVLAGQSNMAWRLEDSDDSTIAKARAKYPNMRYFKINTSANSPKEEFNAEGGKWVVASPETVGDFSAVGFYFAEKIHRDLNVPVGMIMTAMGGTKMISWWPPSHISKLKYAEDYVKKFKEDTDDYVKNNRYEKKLADHLEYRKDYDARCAIAKKTGKPAPTPNWDKHSRPLKWTPYPARNLPSYHWNAKVAPFAKFSVRGVLWYQGESDSGGIERNFFAEIYKCMVNAWRDKWENPKLYFLSTQLPSYLHDWSVVRDGQLKGANELRYSGIANIIDTGTKDDVHPRGKTIVGHRLAWVAERDIYKLNKAPTYAPLATKSAFSKGMAIVEFNTFGNALSGRGEPRGFELKIKGKWVEAKAELRCKDKVFVVSPDANAIPEGVRYLWKGWAKPDVWLYNLDGIPAFPFSL